jgi:hypothetical protein
MAEEMIETWESEEAADWESEESIGEYDESAEDIGERARRTRPRSRFRPGRGVQGIVMRGPGGPQKVPFPTKLATAAETNRGLASQEAGRRALEERLDRLEMKYRAQMKKDSSAAGLVTLGIGSGLTFFGALQSAQQESGSRLSDWTRRESTHIAAVLSASQLATSGAKLAINGRYHRSGLGIAADIFSAGQLAAFAFAFLLTRFTITHR